MRIGQLRHLIQLQQETTVSDGMGGHVSTWATVAEAFAAIEPLSGREYFAAQQTQSTVTHKVTMRYIDGITSAFCVRYGTRVFDIRAVINNEERHQWLILMCEERRP
jgi:SPP1 family predicted phage head-tail adaptor